MRLIISLLVVGMFWGQSFAQTNSIIGDWKGVITQNEGGFRPQYDFEIFIRQDEEGNYVGQTYVRFENTYAKMRFSGRWVTDKYFHFFETEIIDSVELYDMDWCIKKGKLSLERQGNKVILTGSWSGISSYGACVPGYIVLKKKEPRA